MRRHRVLQQHGRAYTFIIAEIGPVLAIADEPGEIRVDEVARPEPGAGEVRLGVAMALIGAPFFLWLLLRAFADGAMGDVRLVLLGKAGADEMRAAYPFLPDDVLFVRERIF